jgi:hypothetical protein
MSAEQTASPETAEPVTQRVVAEQKTLNADTDRWTTVCPTCKQQIIRDLPANSGYTGFVARCCNNDLQAQINHV